MALPTPPTLVSITTEGLKKAGFKNPSASLLTRAQDEWMEELKTDIALSGRKLKSLQAQTILTLTNGRSKYPNPTDYFSDLSLRLLRGERFDTAQAGTLTTITLEAAEPVTKSEIQGRELVITAGTGLNQITQVTDYNETTKVADAVFTVAPDSTSQYLIVSDYRQLVQDTIINYNKLQDPTIKDLPTHYVPIGDDDNGEYILFPVPFRSDSKPLVVDQRYYAFLEKIDLASTLMATIYQRWRNTFVLGIRWKALEDIDDNRQINAKAEYVGEKALMIGRETYGFDMSQLQTRVVDFGTGGGFGVHSERT